jgi:hypothetical protein
MQRLILRDCFSYRGINYLRAATLSSSGRQPFANRDRVSRKTGNAKSNTRGFGGGRLAIRGCFGKAP